MFGRVVTLIIMFPVLPLVLTTAELSSVVSGGNNFHFLPAELALKGSEYFSAIWRVVVNRRVFFPPLSTALMTAEPLPLLLRFVTFPTIIAKIHTFLSTVI